MILLLLIEAVLLLGQLINLHLHIFHLKVKRNDIELINRWKF